MKRWGSYNTLRFPTCFYPQVTLLVIIYTVVILWKALDKNRWVKILKYFICDLLAIWYVKTASLPIFFSYLVISVISALKFQKVAWFPEKKWSDGVYCSCEALLPSVEIFMSQNKTSNQTWYWLVIFKGLQNS